MISESRFSLIYYFISRKNYFSRLSRSRSYNHFQTQLLAHSPSAPLGRLSPHSSPKPISMLMTNLWATSAFEGKSHWSGQWDLNLGIWNRNIKKATKAYGFFRNKNKNYVHIIARFNMNIKFYDLSMIFKYKKH